MGADMCGYGLDSGLGSMGVRSERLGCELDALFARVDAIDVDESAGARILVVIGQWRRADTAT